MSEPHIHIHWKTQEPSYRIIGTEGLQDYGLPNLMGPVDWAPDEDRDTYAEHVFRVAANNLANHYVEARPGEVTRCAWSTLQLQAPNWENAPSADEWLILAETTDPFGDSDQGFTPGVRHAVTILVAQREAINRNTFPRPSTYPYANMTALICRRFVHQEIPRISWWARRGVSSDSTDSGWEIACGEDDHDHEDLDNWTIGHLHHIVADYPFLLPYLPMPEGTALRVSEDGVLLFRPGEDEGHLDPGNPLPWRP